VDTYVSEQNAVPIFRVEVSVMTMGSAHADKKEDTEAQGFEGRGRRSPVGENGSGDQEIENNILHWRAVPLQDGNGTRRQRVPFQSHPTR
jgi:hypothetical protein